MKALAAIHVAKKQLGLDDDTYRAVLKRVTGKNSAGAMNERERQAVVEELRRQGFKRAVKGLEGPFATKLQALWIAAWNLGLVRDRRDAAMLAFVKRQTGIDHVRFLQDAADARKAIEALKGWMQREAGVDWGVKQTLPAVMNDDRFRVAWAQYRRVVPGATFMGNGRDFLRLVATILDKDDAIDIATLKPREWQTLMNDLGARVRGKAQ